MTDKENDMTQDQGAGGVSEEQGTEDVQQADILEEDREGTHAASTSDGDDLSSTEGTEPEVFPAKVVKDLRKENARYRERAQQSDELAHRLHVSLVAQTGKLADPTDLEYAEEHLEDPEVLAAAVDELLARKPHLRARRVGGDVGQGNRGKADGGVDLLEAMRGTL